MMVVITNKLRDNIEASNLKDIEHKSAVGCYEAATFVKNLQKLEFDKLLIDITAIRDASNKDSWDNFKALIEPNKIYILYDEENCDSTILSNLVNRGFYNFGGNTEEILRLFEHPNMFADVQKYIITTSQNVSSNKIVESTPSPNIKKQPPKVVDESVLREFKAEYKVNYDDVNLVPTQLLCTVLIYVLLILTTFIEAKIIHSKMLVDLLSKLPATISSFTFFVLLMLLCYVTTLPIISIAKSKTNSLLRFLIVPSLLSLPLLLGILKIVSEISSSFELILYLASVVVLYIPYMGTLIIRGIVLNLKSENMDVVKWNIFEKIGMFIAIYIFVIPFAQMLLLSLDITFLEGIFSILYFSKVDSNVISTVMLVACILIPILIMISRTINRGRKVK